VESTTFSGFTDTQEELERVSALKENLDIKKWTSLEEMSKMVTTLKDTLNEKRATLAPLISELRPRRLKARDLTQDYDEKKNAYDTKLAGLESNMSKLDQEVRTLREDAMAEESRYHYTQGMSKILQAQQQKVQNELKAYTSGEKKKSQRELLQKRIQEAEKAGKELRDVQKQIREQHSTGLNQMKMWQDLLQIMKMKHETFEQTKKIMLSANAPLGAEDGVTAGNEAQYPGQADMLVL
jgi:intraflagellar transport protein 81